MIWELTPLQLALMGMQIRQRRAVAFVEKVDAARLAYASVQDKDALRAYQRLRRMLLDEAGEGEREVLTPHEVTQQQERLAHPLPAMFQGAPPELWEHIRVIQRGPR